MNVIGLFAFSYKNFAVITLCNIDDLCQADLWL